MRGTFIVLEGTDGSGKTAQFKLLAERLEKNGYEIATFDFPRYEEGSAYFVSKYLNGDYGTAEEVGPYTASMFYALDRYEASFDIQEALDEGKVVIANRYTGSNMAHQGLKFNSIEERKGYFLWLDAIEFQMLRIPRPDISLVLRVPAQIAQELITQREEPGYTESRGDIHEEDLEHLEKSVEVYDNLCELFPKDFKALDCTRSGKLINKENIGDLVWGTLQPLLPDPQSKPSGKKSMTTKAKNPYLTKGKHGLKVNREGFKKLDDILTNSKGSVYAFKETIDPVMVAAAMARLCRRGDDMRVTLLDEFLQAFDPEQNNTFLKRIVAAYGDDSVRQLTGQHLIVEGASNLLTKKLEWGRLASYTEQSTRYIYFDQKDAAGKYRYFVPENLDAETTESYVSIMDKIFDSYSSMVHMLTDYIQTHSSVPPSERDEAWRNATRAQACDAVRPVLPAATKATVGIYGSSQAIESLILHLQSDVLHEAKNTGDKILKEVRKVTPVFYDRTDKPDRGGAIVAYRANTARALKELTQKKLPDYYSPETRPVRLTSVWPRNELSIVPDMLYEHSALPLQEIEEEVDSWTYEQKLEVFKTYMGERLNRRHRPGRALEKIHYSWDLVCDYGIFRDLQRHRMVDDLEWQQLSPRYGYDVPELVDNAGLTDKFEYCFDQSLKLYSILQSTGYIDEAQYATLLGHKMRWKVTFNARAAFQILELRTGPAGHPGYRKLALQIYDKIADVHPLLAEAMRFVNQGEDPELSRLAAERYTQFKLEQL